MFMLENGREENEIIRFIWLPTLFDSAHDTHSQIPSFYLQPQPNRSSQPVSGVDLSIREVLLETFLETNAWDPNELVVARK